MGSTIGRAYTSTRSPTAVRSIYPAISLAERRAARHQASAAAVACKALLKAVGSLPAGWRSGPDGSPGMDPGTYENFSLAPEVGIAYIEEHLPNSAVQYEAWFREHAKADKATIDACTTRRYFATNQDERGAPERAELGITDASVRLNTVLNDLVDWKAVHEQVVRARDGQGVILAYKGKTPKIAASAFIAPTAVIIGDVEIGEEASIWFGVVVRGDNGPIRIGARANVQDNSVIHVGQKVRLTVIEEGVTVGHCAAMEDCVIGAGAVIGTGAVILNGAKIGSQTLIAAGSVVAQDAEIPPRVLAAGSPCGRPKAARWRCRQVGRAHRRRVRQALAHVHALACAAESSRSRSPHARPRVRGERSRRRCRTCA